MTGIMYYSIFSPIINIFVCLHFITNEQLLYHLNVISKFAVNFHCVIHNSKMPPRKWFIVVQIVKRVVVMFNIPSKVFFRRQVTLLSTKSLLLAVTPSNQLIWDYKGFQVRSHKPQAVIQLFTMFLKS